MFGLVNSNNRSNGFSPHQKTEIISARAVNPASAQDIYLNSVVHRLNGYESELYTGWLAPFHNQGYREVDVSLDEVLEAYNLVRKHLKTTPASATAFAALKKLNLDPDESVVVINAGQGIIDSNEPFFN